MRIGTAFHVWASVIFVSLLASLCEAWRFFRELLKKMNIVCIIIKIDVYIFYPAGIRV